MQSLLTVDLHQFSLSLSRKMSSKSPIFAMAEPQHYSDYGFDPQIDYFQVMEEKRRHGRRAEARSPDALHFKLRKPISKEEQRGAKSKKRQRWWKAALLFWKRDKGADGGENPPTRSYPHRAVSGPMYLTDCGGSTAPCRTSRPSSGPLLAAAEGFPYISLRDFNLMEEGHRISASARRPMPIYLVT